MVESDASLEKITVDGQVEELAAIILRFYKKSKNGVMLDSERNK